jgi:hypothetical protein
LTDARELSRYRLDLVGVQEVRREGSSTEPAGEHTFSLERGLGTMRFPFVHKRIISAVKGAEYVSDVIRNTERSLVHVIVLNVHTPTKNKSDYVKASFHEEFRRMFAKFHITYTIL